MTDTTFAIPEVGLQLLQADLQRAGDRMRDEKFCRELYRALADNRWTKEGESVALSWKRAEELINAVRRGLGEEPMTLAQTGGEGTVDSTIRKVFEPWGWTIEPLDTSEQADDHLASPEDPPPASR
ncbi:MAG TPA: hypothetical protein VJT75_00810 [Thermoleophilaceae bacterium]|nr:hypothetical protein [Thermoleophilaceae bacterium]